MNVILHFWKPEIPGYYKSHMYIVGILFFTLLFPNPGPGPLLLKLNKVAVICM